MYTCRIQKEHCQRHGLQQHSGDDKISAWEKIGYNFQFAKGSTQCRTTTKIQTAIVS